MKISRSALVSLLALTALAITTSCSTGGTQSSGSATSKAELRFGIPAEPASLDPAKDDNNAYKAARYLTNEPIVRGNQNGTFGPGLASSFGYVGKGNTKFQFTLRHDARFSDGTPVTASAVKTWFDYFKKVGRLAALLPLKSAETRGKWTVVLTLTSPSPDVPYLLSGQQNWGFVSSPNAVKKPSMMSTGTYGAGEYVLDPSATVIGDTYTFVPNKYYYDKSKIHWAKVTVKVIKNPSSMLQSLRSGQVDVGYGDMSTAKAAAQGGGLTVENPQLGWGGIMLLDHTGKLLKPFGDVRVRQALNYAIDRKAITTGLVGTLAAPTSAFSTMDATDSKLQNYYPYDPAKAKQLLAEAGYANGFTVPVVTQGSAAGVYGDPLTQSVAKYLGRVGVKLKILSAATRSEYLNKALGGGVPAFQNMWGTDYLLPSVGYLFSPDGSVNPLKEPEPVIEKLAAKAAVAPAKDATKIKLQIVQRIVAQAYELPVFTFAQPVYVSKRVGGVSLSRYWAQVPVMTQWYPKD